MNGNGNGRVPVSLGHIISIGGLIFTAGGGWFMLQSQAGEIAHIKDEASQDHDAITTIKEQVNQMTEDVSDLKGDVKAVQSSQIKQEIMLGTILAEIKRGNAQP